MSGWSALVVIPFYLLIVVINFAIMWYIGRYFCRLLLFPNSNYFVGKWMSSTLYKKVTKELKNHTGYIGTVLEQLKSEVEPFNSTRAYDIYCADMIKGIEMLSILLESNLHHIRGRERVSQKF